MPKYEKITAPVRNEIIEIVGLESLVTDTDELAEYETDASDLSYPAEMVVRVENAEQIRGILRLANRYGFPVTPRGAGTGMAGGCLTVQGGLVLSLERMNQILSINTMDLIAEVEPGVITKNLKDAAQRKGLFYPPDPAGMDQSTIGGNASTNAGGPACVKYGVTKNYILGLEAVLPNGELIKTGTKTRKGVVGYDLTQLLVGSEGTLGIITGLTLKLLPHPPAVAGFAAVFPDLHTTMKTVTEVMVRGHLPCALEFMDHKCMAIVGDLLPFDVPGGKSCLLILEIDGASDQIGPEIQIVQAICRELGATHILPMTEEKAREKVWEVRRQVSLRVRDTADIYYPEDIAVPIGRIADFVDTLPKFEEKHGVNAFAFGHAGDGNIHVSICAEASQRIDQVEKSIEEIFGLTLHMQGTISGEHGIGEAKKKFVPMELSSESIRVQKGIKQVFDPNMILNPGKLFP
jgi:glycolate oxidase subunit GlcD